MNRDACHIVSLLPGATEWVCELGLANRLVGVSHECDFPPEVSSLPRVTRARINSQQSGSDIDAAVREHSDAGIPLYDLDAETLVELQPDLILTQSLCNVCAVSQRDVVKCVSAFSAPCRLLDLRAETFDQLFDDAAAIAAATGQGAQAVARIDLLRQRTCRVRDRSGPAAMHPTVTLLEWVDPLFSAGHWTPQLIEWAGGQDPIGRTGTPSRVITRRELFDADPDILLVACCGMDVERTRSELTRLEADPGWSQLQCVRTRQVHAFDGSAYFNRPGPRLVDALERVAELIGRWQVEFARQG